jgi:hypothetical protein
MRFVGRKIDRRVSARLGLGCAAIRRAPSSSSFMRWALRRRESSLRPPVGRGRSGGRRPIVPRTLGLVPHFHAPLAVSGASCLTFVKGIR